MDDSQDKVRRNLVVVAAAIVLIQCLQIEIAPEATNVSIFRVSKVSQLQFWVLTLVVLFYLFQRYWFDEPTKKLREAASEEFYSLRAPLILSKLQDEIRSHVTAGRVLRSVSDIADVVRKYQEAKYPSGQFDHVHIGLLRSTGRNYWTTAGKVKVEITRTKNGDVISSVRSDTEAKYRLSYLDIFRVTTVPILRTALFSKSAVDFLVPLYLTIGALAVCVYRLWGVAAGS